MTLQEFGLLNLEQKEKFCRKIAAHNAQFKFTRLAKFGAGFETGVFEYESSEFVFVPGGEVVLGWADFSAPFDERRRVQLETELSRLSFEPNLRAYLGTHTSPLRTAHIAPMLVERVPISASWHEVELTDERLDEYKDEIAKFTSGGYGSSRQLVLDGELKLTKDKPTLYVKNRWLDDELDRSNLTPNLTKSAALSQSNLRAFLFQSIDIDELQDELSSAGFALASEDEWEYLAGCGARTLFRAGDWLTCGEINLANESDAEHSQQDADWRETNAAHTLLSNHDPGATNASLSQRDTDLCEPNSFGLVIGFDPYAPELVCTPVYFKGGDGGYALCGGASDFLSFLPVSPFWRMDEAMTQDYLDFLDSGELDNAIYRRIFRLSEI